MASENVSPTEVATLKAEVDGIRRDIGAISVQVSSLAAAINERAKTPWATIISAMGVVLAVVVYGGSLAKAPIDQAIARLETTISSQVPRGEHERVWGSYDIQIATANRERDQLRIDFQRQLDELKQAIGGIYGARDVIQEMREDIRALELELRKQEQ